MGEATEGARGRAICWRNGAAEVGEVCLHVWKSWNCSLCRLKCGNGSRSSARQSTPSKAQNEIANCSCFLWMPTTGIPPRSKVVADLATGDSRANVKCFSSFCSNPSNRVLITHQGTKCNIDMLLFPDHFLSVEKWYWSACIVILKFTLKICKTAPYVLEPDTASVAPTIGKVLLVNAALTLNYAMLLYGNSMKKNYFQCWFFFIYYN